MFFTKQGLALAIRPLFDEEDENKQQDLMLTDNASDSNKNINKYST